jgi:hypothetical protein
MTPVRDTPYKMPTSKKPREERQTDKTLLSVEKRAPLKNNGRPKIVSSFLDNPDFINQLLKEGLTYSDIGKRAKASEKTVQRRIDEHRGNGFVFVNDEPPKGK